MNDKELLEMEAKAAGIDGLIKGTADGAVWLFRDDNGSPWNPLTDDGDALRLAAKLSIGLHWCKSGRVYAHHDDAEECESSREDRQANLRRAITRAAAEIGRRM